MKVHESTEPYDTHWSNERAYKKGYAKGYADGKAEIEKPCDFCKGRAYTKKPVTIKTIYGKCFEMVFEYCPNCGRKLRTDNG